MGIRHTRQQFAETLMGFGASPQAGHRGGEPKLYENAIFIKSRSPIGLLPAPAVRRTATISANTFAEIYFLKGKGVRGMGIKHTQPQYIVSPSPSKNQI